MGGSGSIKGIIDLLRNNNQFRKKAQHFSDKEKVKYDNKELKFKEGSVEDIQKVRQKIKRQERNSLLKKLIIFVVSLALVISLVILILNKTSVN